MFTIEIEESGQMANDSTNRGRSEPRPNRERWAIFISAYIAFMIHFGMFQALAKLFVDIRTTFGGTRAQTAAIFSTAHSVKFAGGIVYGGIVSRIGPRKAGIMGSCIATFGFVASYFATSISFLIVSLGILAASSGSCIAIGSAAAVGKHFKGTKGILVLSILATASGVGGMAFPYLIGYLMEKYGLHGTFLILGGIMMQSIPAAALWLPPNDADQQHSRLNRLKSGDTMSVLTINSLDNDSESSLGETASQTHDASNDIKKNALTNISVLDEVKLSPFRKYSTVIIDNISKNRCASMTNLLRNKVFMMYVISMSFVNAGITVFITFIVDYFVDQGLSQTNASLGLTLLNLFSFLGRFIPGIMAQSQSVTVLMPSIISALLCIISLILVSFVKTLTSLLIGCCIMGLSLGVIGAANTATTQALVGSKDMANAVGILFTLYGIGNLAIGPISGALRDEFGSYKTPLLLTTGPLVVAIFLLLLAVKWHGDRGNTKTNSAPTTYIARV